MRVMCVYIICNFSLVFVCPLSSDDGDIETWTVDTHREEDWVGGVAISRLCALPNETHTNTGEFIYQDSPQWSQYR